MRKKTKEMLLHDAFLIALSDKNENPKPGFAPIEFTWEQIYLIKEILSDMKTKKQITVNI